ncbi:protein unc-80 homolog isoform X8 [Panulirus ornatus]|uniref:protein unc-80 homolog isoform X8 n=1 Tax=Panulirus ornatus TaxID=150431 RepID=UPI003A8838D9
MVKRKPADDDWVREELAVPLPIQTFLWRQSSPFIRPKLGKLHEATCMFCQSAPSHHEIKEASKSLEKVLVQNILFGLSPSLTDAIKSIPRWRFIQAAVPHVMHCAASLLYNRRESTITNLGAAETKLLYTLHWIVLDAAEECADSDHEKGFTKGASLPYYFSIATIQVFIYLFAPLLHTLKESDFQNFRLENGLKIWAALWEYRHPDVPAFTTPVRPRRQVLRATKVRRSNTQFGDVFLGVGITPDDDNLLYLLNGGKSRSITPPPSDPTSSSTLDSRVPDAAKLEEELRLLSGTREATFPETIPEETSSTEEEHVVIFRLGSYPDNDGRESHVYKAEHLSSLLRPPTVEISDTTAPTQPPSVAASTPTECHTPRLNDNNTSTKTSISGSGAKPSSLTDPTLATFLDVAVLRCLFVHQWMEEGVYWALNFIYRRLQDISEETGHIVPPRRRSNSLPIPKIHVSLHCDAVEEKKPKEGVEQSDQSSSDYISDSETSSRSGQNSSDLSISKSIILPSSYRQHIPQEGVSERHLAAHRDRKFKFFPPKGSVLSIREFFCKDKEEPETAKLKREKSQLFLDLNSPFMPDHPCPQREGMTSSGGSTRKKKKLNELRAFVETKLRSCSEKALEKIGHEDSRRSSVSEDPAVGDFGGSSWGIDGEQKSRPHSALDKFVEDRHQPGPPSPRLPPVGLVKGKSMPSLSSLIDELPCLGVSEEDTKESPPSEEQVRGEEDCYMTRYVGEGRPDRRAFPQMIGTTHPIITVTQHTPSPSEQGWRDQASQSGSVEGQVIYQRPPLSRSQTDSNIQYSHEEAVEAPGSTHYITRDGHINLHVLLKAAQSVAQRDAHVCSLRVCEILLHLLDFLLDLGLLKTTKRWEKLDKDKDDERGDDDSKPQEKTKEQKPHFIFMDTIVRVYRHLGCQQGCGDGHRGPPAEFLRCTGQGLLARMYRNDQSAFRRFLRVFVKTRPMTEILEFFHAFLGFCVDPGSLLSPMSQKRTGSGKGVDNQQGGYATNFGASLGGAGSRGIEGQLVASVFKALVSRFVKSSKELKSLENMAVYCDVRQLLGYVREAHGGVFRRVALSGLIDSADRPHKQRQKLQTTRVVRRVTIEEDTYRDSPPTTAEEGGDGGKGRKGIFKKKSTSSSITSVIRKAPSVSSVYDDQQEDSPGGQSPVSTVRSRHLQMMGPQLSEHDHLAPNAHPKGRRVSKIVSWFRGRSMEGDLGIGPYLGEPVEIPPALAHRLSHTATHSVSHGLSGGLTRPRLITKPGAGRLSIKKNKLTQARRRMEDQFGWISFGKSKKKDYSCDETPDLSRRNSLDQEGGVRETSVVLVRERKLVPVDLVRNGMLRFSFMLESCQPGSVPDPQLIAAVLDLPGAPVIARAAFLMEIAHFIHRCNHGAWPAWIKMSLPLYRPSVPHSRAVHSGGRRMNVMQRAAGRMFYQWAEALGARLEELLEESGPTVEEVVAPVTDTETRRALRANDEEEDFLDEMSVNRGGADCPMALKLVAVQVLLEITAFLRETYTTLPKSTRMSVRGERPSAWGPPCGGLGIGRDPNRRWSMALSSMGYSHPSAQSLQSIGETHPAGFTGERKISFAVHDPDNVSLGSSNTTVTVQSGQFCEEERRRAVQTSRSHHFLKKGASHNSSFKRRSFKLSRRSKDPDSDSIKRSDSVRSRRKVSAVSERSDTSEHLEQEVSGEESPGVLSNEDLPESPSDGDLDEESLTSNMPWLKVVVRISSLYNIMCTHQTYCHPHCYKRNMRACRRLMHALRKMYGEEFEEQEEEAVGAGEGARDNKKEKKQGRKASEQGHSSPLKRKESFALRDKIDRSVDISAVLSRLGHHQGSAVHLSKDTIDTDGDGKEMTKDSSNKDEEKKKPRKGDTPIIRYMKTQVMGLSHAPLSLVCKGVAVMTEDLFMDVVPQAWELLLEYDNEVTATAAVVFILAGVRVPAHTSDVMTRELTHPDPNTRLNAILRFQVLWQSRYQAWPRMEEGAPATFKVPPHGIEFTLPSPKIGVESLPVVDPPWMPHFKTNVDEVTVNQIQHRSVVTATRTRRKLQAEMVRSALEAEEKKRRMERENFLLTTVPVTIQAAYEPALHHVSADDHEEGEEAEAELGRSGSHHVSVAQQLFPSCLCSAVLTIIHLLDDPAVTPDGIAVYEAAQQVIWSCLVEDSALFLRFFLEKLTRERQDVMVRLLRRLVRFIPRLPSQAAFALYNYMVGYVMFYVRSPQEASQDHIASALSILWTVVPSIQGILFKDIKQIFRKEQCDSALLVTANVPSAKKIIVHDPGGVDGGGIPSQFPIQEDTQFCQILQESLDFFGIPENDQKCYFLVDHKTNQIHNLQSYVRDFYFFKRAQYPQLLMIHMEPEAAYDALQRQAFTLKLLEIGKVLMAWSILKRPDQMAQRVFFLHEELTKLPSFPRKALEADFNLYKGGAMGKEVRGLDQLHKYMWVQLVTRMFEGMAGNLTYTTDLHLFLNVINGALLLHCEDSSMLRLCMAAYINAAHHFKNFFSTNGYLHIMPTILRVYSNYQSNKMVVMVVEFIVKQLYILHRKPFILQMLGSVAPILDMDETAVYGDANKIQPRRLFDLLLSLERHHEDPLHILDLVTVEKPLRALDFCYHEESDSVSLLEAVDMCVTVVAYSADSKRGHQMLTILEAILGLVLRHLQATAGRDLRQEKETIHHVAVAMKTLVTNSEALAKNYTGPQKSAGEGKGSSRVTYSKASKAYNPAIEVDDDSHSKYMSDSKRYQAYERDIEDSEALRHDFRQPRDTLLHVVAEFLTTCSQRLAEINKKAGQESKHSDLLDTKCHLRLAEVAHSLLKVAPYDPATMGCRGLQRYMNEILPHPDWSHEDLRPALVNILRRLDKMFNKIAKKNSIRRLTDWGAAASLLKGVYTTLSKYPYIAHLPHLKMVVQVCQSLILGERLGDLEGHSVAAWTYSPPPHFCSMVVKIIAMQILALGMFSDVTGVTYSLEQICGGSSLFPTPDKTENMIMNLLLPLCLRVGCGRKDAPRMRQADISFALTVVLHAMNPPLAKIAPLHGPQAKTAAGSDPRSQSWSHQQLDPRAYPKVKPTILRIAFLGLKVMMVCFEKQLSQDWHRILHCLRDMDTRGEGGLALWDFLDFVVSFRTPLFIQMRPFILTKLKHNCSDDGSEHYKLIIRDRIHGWSLPPPRCRGSLLLDLAHQVKQLKEEVITAKISGEQDVRPSALEIQSEVSHVSHRPRLSYAGPPTECSTQPLTSPPLRSKGSVSSSSTGCSMMLNRDLSVRSEPRPASLPSHNSQSPQLPDADPPSRRTSFAGESQPLCKGSLRPSPHATSSEPRLYRKTFLLRKRGSKPNLQSSSVPTVPGEDSSVSTPTSPGEGGGMVTGSQESVRSGVRPRLQRQMAQSRKTFRFRKSKHGHTEAQERQPQVAHIDVEPTRLPPVTGAQMVTGEEPPLRELSVPLIPEDDFTTQSHTTTKRERPKSGLIQPEPESVSEISYMETSTISGYRESFGGFDMSLQELERLEMQVRTGRYKEPLTGSAGPTVRKTSMVETRFHDSLATSEKLSEVVHDTSPKISTTAVPLQAPWGPTPYIEKTIDSAQESHQSVAAAHRPQASHQAQFAQHSHSSHISHVSHSQHSSVPVPHPPHTTQVEHTPHSVFVSHPSHISQAGHTHGGQAVHPPHSISSHISDDPHLARVPYAHNSVHFSDPSHPTLTGHSQCVHFSQTPASSHPPQLQNVPHASYGHASFTSHTVPPTIQSSCSIHHGTRSSEPLHAGLHGQSKQSVHSPHSTHHSQSTLSSHATGQTPSYSSHIILDPSKHQCEALQSTQVKYQDHSLQPTKLVHHIQEGTTLQPIHAIHSVPSVQINQSVYHTDQSVCSVQSIQHRSPGHTCFDHGSHSHHFGHTSQGVPSAQATHSTHLVHHSQPTVWRHSWTEGEAKEQRVWGRHEGGGVPQFENKEVGSQEGKSEDNLTTGELTSLLKRLEHRSPSQQSLLVAERDEDTLI